MPVLVTGATGLVGHAVARALLERGERVRALVRSAGRAALLPAGAQAIVGDVTDRTSLDAAVAGVDLIYHAAGLPEQFLRDERAFDAVNRGGTTNVLDAARAAGVRRVVHTSTMDVFGAPRGGTLVETRPDPQPKPTAYERSKVAAEREVDRAIAHGLDVVVVNPGATYGPGPVVGGLNVFFQRLLSGSVPMLPPGGMSVVHASGLAAAHLAAAERGRTGERYLVADAHASNRELAEVTALVAGLGKVPRTAPAGLLRVVAAGTTALGRRLGFSPLLTPGELAFVLWDPRIDTTKARRELGFVPTPLEDGVRDTVAWLRSR